MKGHMGSARGGDDSMYTSLPVIGEVLAILNMWIGWLEIIPIILIRYAFKDFRT